MKTVQTSAKIWAIVPAAGSGQRFSQKKLKQYQMIAHQTVLQHSLERLNVLPLQGYVLVVQKDDDFVQSLSFVHPERAHFCEGGVERVDSVLNALRYLSQIADENDYVLVHDAARPCVTAESLNHLVEQAFALQCSAILATPVRDTLKKVPNGQIIEHTVNRDNLWQAQTPQLAKLGTLKFAIETALAANVTITDEASALEFVQEKVIVVAGRADNIKITYPDDLALAELILASQQKNDLS
ncbi:MAG: 2-C-methyl-D-erythritol 4-phosphate cytidylyltransferase [Acinetobacter sp.]